MATSRKVPRSSTRGKDTQVGFEAAYLINVHPDLSPNERRLWILLRWKEHSETGVAWPSRAWLADYLGLRSVGSVSNSIARLKRLDLLHVEWNRGPSGVNLYQVKLSDEERARLENFLRDPTTWAPIPVEEEEPEEEVGEVSEPAALHHSDEVVDPEPERALHHSDEVVDPEPERALHHSDEVALHHSDEVALHHSDEGYKVQGLGPEIRTSCSKEKRSRKRVVSSQLRVVASGSSDSAGGCAAWPCPQRPASSEAPPPAGRDDSTNGSGPGERVPPQPQPAEEPADAPDCEPIVLEEGGPPLRPRPVDPEKPYEPEIPRFKPYVVPERFKGEARQVASLTIFSDEDIEELIELGHLSNEPGSKIGNGAKTNGNRSGEEESTDEQSWGDQLASIRTVSD